MTTASNIAHGLLLRHAATPDHQLALPVDPADAALAVRLGERLRELKPYSDVLDRMFTGFSDRLPNGERADTGWAPPTSTAVMDDGLRERMRRAIEARTWQEFLDAVYKLGLFRED